MNFQQNAQDKKGGMSLGELKQFVERVEKLGVSDHERLKANNIKLKSISISSDPEMWSD